MTPAETPAAPFVVRGERPEDRESVAQLHRRAFGGQDRVVALVEALRPLVRPACGASLVAVDEGGAAVGHVLFTPGLLDAPQRLVTVAVLSPLGVSPDWQRRGVGRALVAAGVALLTAQGVPLVFLEGIPAYYPRLGFRPAVDLGFRKPSLRIPDEAFQVLPLSPEADGLSGTLVYDALFWQLDAVGLR